MIELKRIFLILLALLICSCGFFGGLSGRSAPDRAPNVSMNASKIDDAVPRVEPRSRGGNRSPYQVFGKWYKVVDSTEGYRERGLASWYGVKFHGNQTANGETYNMYEMTAAHKHLPLPSYVQVKNLENGKQVIVRVNDRGPFHGGRIIDLSYAAATKLDILKKGTARVEIEVIDPKQWLAEQKAKKRNKKQSRPESRVAANAVTPTAGKLAVTNTDTLYLQVAAYQNLATAQSLQNRLLAKLDAMGDIHADTNVVIHPSSSGQLYRVRIGPLLGDAQLSQLQQHDSLSVFGNMYPVKEPF